MGRIIREKDMEIEVIKKLKQMGLPIVKKEERKKSRVADLVGYVFEANGALTPEVVVEIKDQPSMQAQQQLMKLAKTFSPAYALLATPEKYIWFDTETFLPTEEEPVFRKSTNFTENTEELKKKIWEVIEVFRDAGIPSSHYWLRALEGLLVRKYFYDQARLNEWESLSKEKYDLILSEARKYYGLEQQARSANNADHSFLLEYQLTDLQFDYVQWKLGEMPSVHADYGKAVTELMEYNEEYGPFSRPLSVTHLFSELVDGLGISTMNILEMGSGYGSITHALQEHENTIENIIAAELNPYVFYHAKIMTIVSGKENIEHMRGDVLDPELSFQTAPNVVIMDSPFGSGLFNDEKYASYTMNKGKSSKLNYTDMFMERGINLVDVGGYVVALVPEAFLFNAKQKKVRSLVKEKTIIEAIISLPSHTLRPVSGVKVSILVLRKKQQQEQEPKELFVASCEAVDQFSEAVAGYREWKKEASSRL